MSEVEFINYAAAYGKTYSSKDEWDKRSQIFLENHKMINDWNKSPESAGTQLSHNKFSDWEDHEYQGLLKRTGTE